MAKPSKLPPRIYCIEGLTPISYNNAYPTSKSGHRFLSYPARLLKESLVQALTEIDSPAWGESPEEEFFLAPFYEVLVAFYMPYDFIWRKNSKLYKRDVSNFLKFVEDAIYEYLGRGDKGSGDEKTIGISGHKCVSPDDKHYMLIHILPQYRLVPDETVAHFLEGGRVWKALSER